MDAITLLTDDHKKVRALLTELADTTNRAEKTRTELLAKIAQGDRGPHDDRGGDLLPGIQGRW